VVLGALGKRELESGTTEALAEGDRPQVRRQAFGVVIRSVVVGVAATVIVWALSELLRR